MHRSKVALFTIAFIALTFAGCTKPSVSDDSIANDIKAKLYSDQATKAANINVGVKDGVVTLSGDVPSADVALAAMRVANGTNGIRSVADQLTINGAAAASQLPQTGNDMASQPSGNVASPPPPAKTASAPPPSTPPANAGPAPGDGAPPSANVAAIPPRAQREPVPVEIPAGSDVSVRTIDPIDSKTNDAGQTFRASLNAPLRADGRVIVPAGADATLELASSKSSGRFVGRPELEIRLASVQYRGQQYRVDSSVYSQSGGSRGRQTAVRSGIGAAAGAVIGAIAGGGKGAAIGSLAGGGAGAGSGFFTKGPQVKIPPETILTFRLEAPLTVQHR